VGRGSFFRADWYPGRNHSFSFGLQLPIFQPHMGKTRPQKDSVKVPKGPRTELPLYTPGAELQEALANVEHAAEWIARFTTPFIDTDGKNDEKHAAAFMDVLKVYKEHIAQQDGLYPNGHTFEAEIEQYHAELATAFALASGGDGISQESLALGDYIARGVNEMLRDEMILPYNRLLSQRKENDSLLGYGRRAMTVFTQYLQAEPRIGPHYRPGVTYVFQKLMQYMEANRRALRERWGDSRHVWLPLHWVLNPDQVDTHDELDAVLENILERKFTDQNDVHYVINEQFTVELGRMILEAEDYHVLWIHDYDGKNKAGAPDRIGFRMTLEAYLPALINAAEEYDTTWRIPTYMIFLDEFFFEATDGRLWLTLLSDPLNHTVDLPKEYAGWEERLRAAQDQLRAAVAQSAALQEGARQYGRKWLENKLKVHVNITNQTDMTFRSRHLIGGVWFVPDILMRDHRKITFYDVSEIDPGKGEAMYTGMGVGEQYTGPTWDDRAILVRGPMLLGLKDEARELLKSQGFKEEEIPVPLRPLPKDTDYDEKLAALHAQGWDARALQLHNGTGFAPKRANLVKATLYNLMPKGSHIYMPDSIWNSALWGSFVMGCALRGCWVLPIAPALANAPADAAPVMSRAAELLQRFVMFQNEMSGEIDAAGGLFRTGIFDLDVDVDDSIARIRKYKERILASPFFRKVFPFDSSVYEMMAGMDSVLEAQGYKPVYLSEDAAARLPKLHMKSQFFATKEALSTLIPRPGWKELIYKYQQVRAEQRMRKEDTSLGAKELRSALSSAVLPLVQEWRQVVSPDIEDRIMFYLAVGSHNQNYRSSIMDGEVVVLVARLRAMIAYLDFVGVMVSTTWIETLEQLEELLPHHKGKTRWLGRTLRNAL
jgi:hypothetical protein